MKWSVIADHLADNAIEDYEPLNFDFLDEDVLVVEKKRAKRWTMFFDETINVYGNGTGAMIIYPNKKQYLVSIKL